MSGKLMGAVFGIVLPSNKRAVLLAMADHATDDGRNVRPSQALIAWKTDYSVKQVGRIIESLVDDGLLVPVLIGKPFGKPNEYQINLAAGKSKPDFRQIEATKEGSDISEWGQTSICPTPIDDKAGSDIAMSYPGQTSICPTGSDIMMSDDPSLNHHNNHQEKDSSDQPIGGHENQPSILDGEPSTPGPTPKPPTDHQLFFEAICKAFGYDYKLLTDSKRGVINRTSQQLRKAGATLGDIPAAYSYCEEHFDNFGPAALSSHLDDMRAERQAKQAEIDSDGDPLNDPAFMARAKFVKIHSPTLQEIKARAAALKASREAARNGNQ